MKRIASFLWGNLSTGELVKFMLLALGAFFMIGSYYPLASLKKSIFLDMVGGKHLYLAKQVSLVANLVLVLLYNRLVDFFSKQRLIYAFLLFYASLGCLFVFLLSHPTIGMANKLASFDRYLGWAFFVFAETYLTVMVALYWSFINDVTTSESAKKGYGIIVTGSQCGGFTAAFMGKILISDTRLYDTRVPLIVCISVVMFLLMGVCVWLVNTIVPKSDMQGEQGKEPEKKPTAGFFEGVLVLLRTPYVAGIFGIMFFQEIISSLMDIYMTRMAEVEFVERAVRSNFFFSYNLALQFIAVTFALLGTSALHRYLGTRWSLIAFPSLLMAVLSIFFVWRHLYAVALFMIAIKAFHYAFNMPVKETLYIPTTKDVKYKAKSWIDMFGLRFSKSIGSFLGGVVEMHPYVIGIFSVIGLGAWITTAGVVGTVNEKALKRDKIIG